MAFKLEHDLIWFLQHQNLMQFVLVKIYFVSQEKTQKLYLKNDDKNENSTPLTVFHNLVNIAPEANMTGYCQ